MKIPSTLVLLLSIAALAGCAGPRAMVPGQSTIVEMRARVGTPTDIRFDRNGDELWEYATGPMGYETYLVRIGTDGKVREVTQILTEDQMMKLVPGTMTKADARNLLGRPSDQTFTGAVLAIHEVRRAAGLPDGEVQSRQYRHGSDRDPRPERRNEGRQIGQENRARRGNNGAFGPPQALSGVRVSVPARKSGPAGPRNW
jgi:hypothetical protein